MATLKKEKQLKFKFLAATFGFYLFLNGQKSE
jgi:hypothetical protein